MTGLFPQKKVYHVSKDTALKAVSVSSLQSANSNKGKTRTGKLDFDRFTVDPFKFVFIVDVS